MGEELSENGNLEGQEWLYEVNNKMDLKESRCKEMR